MDHKDKSVVFKALGDPTRLRVFEFLRSCCCPVAVGEDGEVRPVLGPTVGEVCCSVTGSQKITSSLSFHLKELRNAEIITMERRGKHMICGINRETLTGLSEFFSLPEQKGCDSCEC